MDDDKPSDGFPFERVPAGQDWVECSYISDSIIGLREMLALSRIIHEEDNVIYVDFES